MTTPTEPRPSRFVVLLLAIVMIAAACGDDDPGGATPVGDDGSQPAGDDDGDEPPEPPSGSGDGGATVTIGIEQFDFEQEIVCIALGGAVSGSFSNGEGVEISIDVPPEDWETSTTGDWDPPSLTLRDERDEMNWRIFEAGPELATTYGADAEDAVITNFSVDGSRATGNGMAIDTFAFTRSGVDGAEAPQPVPVTFGFECS